MYGLDEIEEEHFLQYRSQSTDYLIEILKGLAILGQHSKTHIEADLVLQVLLERFQRGINENDVLTERILTAYNDIPKWYA